MQQLDMILVTIVLFAIFIASIYFYICFLKRVYDCRVKPRVCTYKVEAKVIKCRELWLKGGGTAYIPTYMYEYNGKTYIYKTKIERYLNNIEDEMKTILINPDKPKIVYEIGTHEYTPIMAICVSIPFWGIIFVMGYIIKYILFGL